METSYLEEGMPLLLCDVQALKRYTQTHTNWRTHFCTNKHTRELTIVSIWNADYTGTLTLSAIICPIDSMWGVSCSFVVYYYTSKHTRSCTHNHTRNHTTGILLVRGGCSLHWHPDLKCNHLSHKFDVGFSCSFVVYYYTINTHTQYLYTQLTILPPALVRGRLRGRVYYYTRNTHIFEYTIIHASSQSNRRNFIVDREAEREGGKRVGRWVREKDFLVTQAPWPFV